MENDLVEMGICRLCREPLKLQWPDAVNYNGEMVHRKCVPEIAADRRNRSDSYT